MASPSASQPAPNPTTTAPDTTPTPINAPTYLPSGTLDGPAPTSLHDSGLGTRPRDARTIHMVLASLGVSAYQERVPLQLLDFAYRYTAGVLGDAQHLAAEGYVAMAGGGGAAGKGKGDKGAVAEGEGQIGLQALKLATASRNGYQFGGVLPKEAALELAAERNKVRLPEVGKEVVFGVRLPQERFVMTGTGWDMLEEWDSEVEDEGSDGEVLEGAQDVGMELVNGIGHGLENGDGEDEDMADDDGYDQIFGRDGDADEDEMEEG